MAESHAAAHVTTRPRDMRTGYVWYDLGTATIEGDEVYLSLCFFKGKLEMISFAVVGERFGRSWGEWSAEKEQQRAEATRDWLDRIGFPVGTYPWGVVWAGTDAKTGDGGGVIRFS